MNIVAVSGGVDSVVLLHKLHKEGKKCVVAHVHHGLRKESDIELKAVESITKSYGYTFESIRLENPPKTGFEEYARNFRYDFFRKLADKYNTNIIYFGHHKDDLAETVLMRLIQGAYGKGLIGMSEYATDGTYIYKRPLIHTRKEDLYSYAKDNSLLYFEDSSNKENDYTRNRLRNNIIPLLEQENSGFVEAMRNLSVRSKEDEHYFVGVANDFLEGLKIRGGYKIPTDDWLDLHRAIKHRVLDKVVQECNGVYSSTILEVLNEKLKASTKDATGIKYVSQGLNVIKSKQFIYLVTKPSYYMEKTGYILDTKLRNKLGLPSAFKYSCELCGSTLVLPTGEKLNIGGDLNGSTH